MFPVRRIYCIGRNCKLSEAFELMPGDIIYSGTPGNVGPVVKGDVIEMHIDKLPNLSVKIV
jgi:2-keto-4-pentenoate hydratase/2-oxohepta-3-ene-1,7-dioic acid hydratase in catechol pathway